MIKHPSGLVLIDKPAGITSFGVVARVRRQLSEQAGKRMKVGHTGTLDPFATGLLILVVGDYTKRAAEFSKLDKTYEATLVLGQVSSTGDPEGELKAISSKKPLLDQVETAVGKFVGQISQTPPVYSAIKVGGVRAYKLARRGEEVEMPSRQVTIHDLKILDYKYPELKIVCSVSSGTYIRTLAEDIGRELGVGAYTLNLRRLSVGGWNVGQAQKIDEAIKVIEI